MTSIRDQIKEADDRPSQEVNIPEWGKGGVPLKVWVRSMGVTERDDYEASLIEGRGKSQRVSTKGARQKMLVQTVVDAEGAPVFTHEDIAWLGEKSAKVVDRLVDIAMALCGMTDKDIEHLVGN